MNLHQLAQAGRQPDLPLSLSLAGAELQLVRWLRVLPGQRYVGLAHWQGRPVLAKLLVGPKAARQFQRETAGAALLASQAVDTPRLLAQGFDEAEGGWLLFDYLSEAESLSEAWQAVAQQPALSAAQQAILTEALGLIARLHGVGLWQDDLHLDNLLRHQQRLYLIDGGGVRAEHPGQPLSQAQALDNLGVLFAQLPARIDPFIEPLLSLYQQINPAHVLPRAALQRVMDRVRRWRLGDYLKKAGRDCSLFSVRRGPMGLRAVWRAALPRLAPLLDNLDAFIAQGHIYKTGGAATVARVLFDDQPLVIKRYNIKNVQHWLKRFWRPSRAWHSWREAQRLKLLDIATPQPLAVLEQRYGGLRGPAWLVTEYLPGPDLLALFEPYQNTQPPEHLLVALDRLFAALIRERISHGDLKGHNLLWDEALGQWSLIDLDAMQQHACPWRFARAYRQDRARFLRNWPADSPLYRLLDQRLPH